MRGGWGKRGGWGVWGAGDRERKAENKGGESFLQQISVHRTGQDTMLQFDLVNWTVDTQDGAYRENKCMWKHHKFGHISTLSIILICTYKIQ